MAGGRGSPACCLSNLGGSAIEYDLPGIGVEIEDTPGRRREIEQIGRSGAPHLQTLFVEAGASGNAQVTQKRDYSFGRAKVRASSQVSPINVGPNALCSR